MLTQLMNLGNMNMGVNVIFFQVLFELFFKVGQERGAYMYIFVFILINYMTVVYGKAHKKQTRVV